MTPAFWKNRRVLVTGHTGFKGSWLSLWLQEMGASVTGLALPPPTDPSLFDQARVGQGLGSRIADIRDAAAVRAAVAGQEIVFHLAAQPLVRASYEDPLETYSVNLLGTLHVIEAVRHAPGVRAVVVVTTDKCYQNLETRRGYHEDDRLGGHDPYSNSKACVELAVQACRDSFFPAAEYARHGVALATARAGNVLGGGDWARDRLAPDVLRAALEARPVILRYPAARRPWQHVLDPLAGYLLLAEKLWHDGPAYAEAWNFGPDPADGLTVAEVTERLLALAGSSADWRQEPSPQPYETGLLALDCGKARARLGWRPRWNLERTLAAIVDWERAFRRGDDPRATTLAQIREFANARPA